MIKALYSVEMRVDVIGCTRGTFCDMVEEALGEDYEPRFRYEVFEKGLPVTVNVGTFEDYNDATKTHYKLKTLLTKLNDEGLIKYPLL